MANRVLTEAQVIDLRYAAQRGEKSLRQLAKDYGVAPSTVSDIVTGRRRTDCEGPLTRRGGGTIPPRPVDVG